MTFVQFLSLISTSFSLGWMTSNCISDTFKVVEKIVKNWWHVKRKQKFSVFLIYIFHYFLFSLGEIVFPSQIFGVLRKISFTSLSHSQYSVFCWFFLFTIPIEFFIPSWIFFFVLSMFRWNLICLQNCA